jgi:hypothetical protein|tara:strand:- start:370 stop:681 length:312 start_codon:yes stop_codon:yes gene_type:complete
MIYDEYILDVVDQDNDSYSLKTFAANVAEAIDNMVCMDNIITISSIKRLRDNKEWVLKSKIELEELREIRSMVSNEIELFEILSNSSEEDLRRLLDDGQKSDN